MDAAMHRNSLLSFWGVHAAVRREPSVRPAVSSEQAHASGSGNTDGGALVFSRMGLGAAAAVDLKRSGQKALGDVTPRLVSGGSSRGC
jgi:hypothetical protein